MRDVLVELVEDHSGRLVLNAKGIVVSAKWRELLSQRPGEEWPDWVALALGLGLSLLQHLPADRLPVWALSVVQGDEGEDREWWVRWLEHHPAAQEVLAQYKAWEEPRVSAVWQKAVQQLAEELVHRLVEEVERRSPHKS
jgi:hypothetical protein